MIFVKFTNWYTNARIWTANTKHKRFSFQIFMHLCLTSKRVLWTNPSNLHQRLYNAFFFRQISDQIEILNENATSDWMNSTRDYAKIKITTNRCTFPVVSYAIYTSNNSSKTHVFNKVTLISVHLPATLYKKQDNLSQPTKTSRWRTERSVKEIKKKQISSIWKYTNV